MYRGKPIRLERADKKFCDAGCKDEYYNSIRSLEHRKIGKIDRILKRNRRVQKKLDHSNRTDKLFEWEELVWCGFDFRFHTHIGGAWQAILCCYDYGYRKEAEGHYRLFRVNGVYEV